MNKASWTAGNLVNELTFVQTVLNGVHAKTSMYKWKKAILKATDGWQAQQEVINHTVTGLKFLLNKTRSKDGY